MSAPQRPSVLDYDDYRSFLRDWFSAAPLPTKKTFAGRAGCNPATVTLVLQGKRNLSHERCRGFLSALERSQALSPEEREAFPLLVQLNQLPPADRAPLRRRLDALRTFHRSHAVEGARYELFSDPVLPVVHELVSCAGFREDPAWIAARLQPPIEPARAAWALARLQELGMLRRGDDGTLESAEGTMLGVLLKADTPKEQAAKSLALKTMHRRVVEDSWRALEQVPRAERHFGTTTVAIDSAMIDEIKRELQIFEQRLLALSKRSQTPDRVYQLNLQLFPLTRSTRED